MFDAPTKVGARPACAEPGMLPLVDAAFDRTRGPGGARKAVERLQRAACSRCPVALECLAFAQRSHEHGPWAGTTGPERGQPTNLTSNLGGVHRGDGP